MYLDVSGHLDELALLNAAHTDRKVQAVAGTGGVMLVGADLLKECGEGQYWHGFASLLNSLPETDAVPVETEPD